MGVNFPVGDILKRIELIEEWEYTLMKLLRKEGA